MDQKRRGSSAGMDGRRPALQEAAAENSRATPAAAFEALEANDLVAQVTDRLARAICDGRLAPGQRLVEAALARQLGISRAPVREAARRLEQRGLLVAHPRRGFFVRDFSLEEIDDLYGLRIALERYAGELACQRATVADLERLENQLKLLFRLAEEGAVAAQVEADLRFHLLFCEASGNRKLLKLFTDIAGEIRMIIVLIGQLYEDPHRIAETHRPLIEALKMRDTARLDAEIDHHIRVGWQEVRRFFAERGAPETRDDSLSDEKPPAEKGGI